MGGGGARCCFAEKRVPTKGLQNNKWPRMICESWHQPMGIHVPGGWGHRIASPVHESRVQESWLFPRWLAEHGMLVPHSSADSGDWGSGPRGTGGPSSQRAVEEAQEWAEGSSMVEKPGEPHQHSPQWRHSFSLRPEGSQIWSNRNSMWPGTEAHLRQRNAVQAP